MINFKNNYIQDKYLKYAQDVVSGKQVAGKLIRLSCQRYLDLMNDTRYEFRPDKCERVLSFQPFRRETIYKYYDLIFKLRL